jgi:hypothetical protein
MLVRMQGLGASTSSQITSGVQIAGAGTAVAASSGALAAIGITSAAIPIIGPIVSGVALLISALGVGNGCGSTCTNATQVVNTIEPYMQQNLAAAQQQATANGGCLTSTEVTTLTNNFNSLWQQVLSGCGAIAAPGGTQCISDRQQGGKYDWFSYYLDPIQAIPVCESATSPAPTSVGSSVESVSGTPVTASSTTSSSGVLLLVAAAALAFVAFTR